MDDHQLMEDIQSGDQQALSRLYDLYAEKFRCIAMWDIWGVHDAEDVVQELFIEIWNKAGTYDSEKGTPFTWMYTILKRRVIDKIRRKQSYANRLTKWSNECEQDYDGTREEIDHNDRAKLVREAITTLPKAQQAAVLNTYMHDMTQRQVSRHTGLARSTVQTQLRLGLAKIRDFMYGKL